MKCSPVLLMLFLVTGLTGCTALTGCDPLATGPGDGKVSDPKSFPAASPFRPATAADVAKAGANGGEIDGKRYHILVRIEIITLDLPLGTVSSSERIWSYLDEEILGEKALVSLGRNGMRIGAGRADSWPDVNKILRELNGRGLKAATHMAEPGHGISFLLKRDQPAQTIFLFTADRTLQGRDYPAGDNVLMLACTFDPDQPQKIRLSGLPVIRSSGRRTTIVRQPGRLNVVAKAATFPLDALAFQMQITAGDFLILGPGATADRDTSAGHHFLIERKAGGVQTERVLILRPQVVAAEVHRKKPLPADGFHMPPGEDR